MKRMIDIIRKNLKIITSPSKVEIKKDIVEERLRKFHRNVLSSAYYEGVINHSYKYDLSIIVATYNNEKYLKYCIDSIINQKTEFSIEIIIIDDGSTDKTYDVLKLYQEYPAIKIISQKNQGHSGARNTGINLSNGKYLMFVDSDDQLCKNAVQVLLQKAIENDADVVAGDYRITFTDSQQESSSKMGYKDEKINPMERLYGQPWGKVYKHKLFDNLRFPNNYWFEDSIFAQIVWPMCNNVWTVPECVYKYLVNPNGVTNTSLKNKKALDSLYITQSLLEDRKKFGLEYDKDSYKYFLKMVGLTYRRTRYLPSQIQQCIFIVQCELYNKYFKNMKLELQDKEQMLQYALETENYKMYIKCCI